MFFQLFVTFPSNFIHFFFCPFHCMHIFHINKIWDYNDKLQSTVAGDKHFDDKFCKFVNPLLK